MSVLMKGMPMPRNCLECGVQINPFCVTKGIIDFGTRGKRPENCPLAEAPEWIPMTKRMPEIMHTVIVSGRMKYDWETDFFRFVDVATYTEGEFFETYNDWYEGQDEFEITHWMPLPEPPKEES